MARWAGSALQWGYEEEEFVRIAFALGVEADWQSERFPCILPGHRRGCTAALAEAELGHYLTYHCDEKPFDPYFGQSEVRAALAYGEVRRISTVESPRWGERLLWEAGVDPGPNGVPSEVVVRNVPADSPNALTVARGIALYLGLRNPEEWEADAPFLFTQEFTAAYCGLTIDKGRAGMRALRRAGSIVPAPGEKKYKGSIKFKVA